MEFNPLLVFLLANIFSHSECCLLILFIVCFAKASVSFGPICSFFFSSFFFISLGSGLKRILLGCVSMSVLPKFSFKSFIVPGLTFKFLIHFEFISVVYFYGIRRCSGFILLHVSVQFSQHHLLKRLSFLHCIFLPPLSKIKYP